MPKGLGRIMRFMRHAQRFREGLRVTETENFVRLRLALFLTRTTMLPPPAWLWRWKGLRHTG